MAVTKVIAIDLIGEISDKLSEKCDLKKLVQSDKLQINKTIYTNYA